MPSYNIAALALLLSSSANVDAFYIGVPSRTAATHKPSSSALGMRRPLSLIRPSGFFRTDVDNIFAELDDLIDGPFMRRRRRNSSSALQRVQRDADLAFRKMKPFTQGQYNITQNDTEFKLTVDLPGVEAKNINVQLEQDGRVLRLSGKKKQAENGMAIESRFDKTFVLNEIVDTSKITADLINGVLIVTAPKKENEKKAGAPKIEGEVAVKVKDEGQVKESIAAAGTKKGAKVKGEEDAKEKAESSENQDVSNVANKRNVDVTLRKLKPFAPGPSKITQDEKEFKLSADLPGAKASDIDVQLEQNGRVLRLRGERKQEEHGMSLESRFDESFVLDPSVDTSKMVAELSSEGILIVTAPKKEIEKKTEVQKIEIKELGGTVAVKENDDALVNDVVAKENDVSAEEQKKVVATQAMKETPAEEVGVSTGGGAGSETTMLERDFPY